MAGTPKLALLWDHIVDRTREKERDELQQMIGLTLIEETLVCTVACLF